MASNSALQAAARPAAAPPSPVSPPPAAPAQSPAASAAASAAPETNGHGHGHVLAKPPDRKMAKDLGVDLAVVTGTGPNGSITRDDVQAALSEPTVKPAQIAPVAAVAREERIPVRGVRKHTAAAVSASAFSAPHVTEFLQIDMTETMTALQRLRELPEYEGLRPSPLLLVAKAL